MEDIEQLKQDNAKLQERLNNAAKFFREQKAQIESLTKENEELKRTPKEEVINTEKWNALVIEKEYLSKKIETLQLQFNQSNEEVKKVTVARDEWIEKYRKIEKDIESKDLYIKELQNTYNEVFAEKEKITKQFKEQTEFESDIINTKVPELETKLHNAEDAYEELRKKYSEIKELHDGDLNRYNELENNYEALQNKYNEVKENLVSREDFEKLKKISSELNETNINLKKQLDDEKELLGQTSKKCEELRESNKMLQDNSVKLNNDIQTYQKKYDETKVLIEEYKEKIGDLNATIKTQQEENELLNQQLTDANGDREAFRSQLVDLEKKYDQLDKLYDTCEAEKLSAQADCDQLQEMIKYIEENNISDKEWQNHLEDVITQIRNLADDVINPKPETKENVMKRTGDYNVSGENIGV